MSEAKQNRLAAYMPMHIGKKIFIPENGKVGVLTSWSIVYGQSDLIFDVHYSDKDDDWDVFNDNTEEFDRAKPILRKLSSMTEEEARTTFELIDRRVHEMVIIDKHGAYSISLRSTNLPDHSINIGLDGTIVYYREDEYGNKAFTDDRISYPIVFRFFLSKSFDLFNLIDSGLAIDESTP